MAAHRLQFSFVSAQPFHRAMRLVWKPALCGLAATAAAAGLSAGPQTMISLNDAKNDKNVKSAMDTADALYSQKKFVEIKALETGDDNFAVHKWYGIILNKVGEFKGTKAQIQNSFVVKSHWERATTLNPKDPTSSALLGEWCFNVAGLSAVTRAVASAIFASPPSATYTEALRHFLEAEGKEPGFWNKNRLMIAKCHIALGQPDQARPWLDSVLKATATTSEDEEVAKEATVLSAKYRK